MVQVALLARMSHCSQSDSEPAGSVGPNVAGGPVGPYGTLSPSDSEPAGSVTPYVAGGPIGPDGMLSPFISDPVGPYVAGGPVGPHGTLSPSDSGSAILVDPGGVSPFLTLYLGYVRTRIVSKCYDR